jgi:hypothetical protein
MIECAWCAGFWVTVLVSAAWFLWPEVAIYALVPLAASVVVGVVAEKL